MGKSKTFETIDEYRDGLAKNDFIYQMKQGKQPNANFDIDFEHVVAQHILPTVAEWGKFD